VSVERERNKREHFDLEKFDQEIKTNRKFAKNVLSYWGFSVVN